MCARPALRRLALSEGLLAIQILLLPGGPEMCLNRRRKVVNIVGVLPNLGLRNVHDCAPVGPDHKEAQRPRGEGVLEGVAELQSLLPRDGPRLLYLTTPTQHFNTSEGQYEENARAIGCVSDVPVNPRAELERAILRPANVSLVEYDDLRLGRLHVGGRDCSHYCMPGKPDEVAARLVAAATGS